MCGITSSPQNIILYVTLFLFRYSRSLKNCSQIVPKTIYKVCDISHCVQCEGDKNLAGSLGGGDDVGRTEVVTTVVPPPHSIRQRRFSW